MKKRAKQFKSKTVARGRKATARPEAGSLARYDSGQLQAPASKCLDQEVLQQKVIEKYHPHFLGFHAYFKLSDAMGGGLLDTAGLGAGNFIMEPLGETDPLLSLAHNLALLAHGRAAWLTQKSVAQTDARSLAVHLQGCERATSTFVHLMDAIAKNRQAKKPSAKISITQANVAHQQVVHNVQRLGGAQARDDEQTRMQPVVEAEAVSAVSEGIAGTEARNPPYPTLDEKHGAKERCGKGSLRHERA